MADVADIRRNGLRPYIVSTNIDFSGLAGGDKPDQLFNKMMADIMMNMHVKWSGSIRMRGVQEPISVGDNLEYENVVYHIEGVTHSGFIDSNGRKSFDTSVMLSHGISTKTDLAEDDVMVYEAREEEEGGFTFESDSIIGREGQIHKDAVDRGVE